jgi:hypothetical protein
MASTNVFKEKAMAQGAKKTQPPQKVDSPKITDAEIASEREASVREIVFGAGPDDEIADEIESEGEITPVVESLKSEKR